MLEQFCHKTNKDLSEPFELIIDQKYICATNALIAVGICSDSVIAENESSSLFDSKKILLSYLNNKPKFSKNINYENFINWAKIVYEDCKICNNDRKLNCKKCKALGLINCSYCNGTGVKYVECECGDSHDCYCDNYECEDGKVPCECDDGIINCECNTDVYGIFNETIINLKLIQNVFQVIQEDDISVTSSDLLSPVIIKSKKWFVMIMPIDSKKILLEGKKIKVLV